MKDQITTERFIQLPIGVDFREPGQPDPQYQAVALLNRVSPDDFSAYFEELGIKRQAD